MQKRNVIGLLLAAGVSVLVWSCAWAINRKADKPSVGVVHPREEEIMPYEPSVMINGKKTAEKYPAILYQKEIYLAKHSLTEEISADFISYQDGELTLRRNRIPSAMLLEVQGEYYVPLELLADVLHINNDVRQSTGELYLDTMLHDSIYYHETKYVLTENFREAWEFPENPDWITEDGRGVWTKEKDLWVENDWGLVCRYAVPKNQVIGVREGE